MKKGVLLVAMLLLALAKVFAGWEDELSLRDYLAIQRHFGITIYTPTSYYQKIPGLPNIWDYGRKCPTGCEVFSIKPPEVCPTIFQQYGVAFRDNRLIGIVAQTPHDAHKYELLRGVLTDLYGPSFKTLDGTLLFTAYDEYNAIYVMDTNLWTTMLMCNGRLFWGN